MVKFDRSEAFFKLLSIVFVILIIVLSVVFYSMGQNNEKKEVEKMSNPIAVFETSKGSFEVELFLNESPVTAGNFKKLVEEGFYDGTRFHRVISDFMIQGGDPLSKNTSMKNRWGTGGPGYAIKDEFVKGLSNVRGTISMANSGPNSGGSQFFINVADNTPLDWDKAPSSSKHPVFGKVISGMEVVDAISVVNTTGRPSDKPLEDVIVNKVYIYIK